VQPSDRPFDDAPPAHPRWTRRAAIQAGAVGILGLGMNHLAALGAVTQKARAKSVIYVFLSGGLSQHDTFDMKPEAPREVRSVFDSIATRTPGLRICEHLPRLARCSERWALVRSMTHPSNDHSAAHHIMLTGRSDLPLGFDPNKPKDTDWPSIAAHAAGALSPRNNLPPAIVLPDKLVHRTGRTIPGQFAAQLGKARDPWFLEMSPYHPADYGAFPTYLFHHEKGPRQDAALVFQAPHLALPEGLSIERIQDRAALRDALERQSRAYEQAAGDESFDACRQAALSLLTRREVHAAFDLTRAEPRWLDRYGRNSFGWSLLMARQLVEAGVRLVQVNLGNNETWDTHQSMFPNLKEFLLPPFDLALSALVEDLASRGLLEETLVVVGSEFGRTPKLSTLPGAKQPGRDHWGATQSILLAGGGVRGGNVIGATDRTGAFPSEDAQRPENLAATIYEALALPRELVWHDRLERPHQLYEAAPIKGLA